jgi:acyl carrier protein
MSDYRDDVVLTVICPSCGEVDLTTDQVWLVIASAADRSHYRFRCAGCNLSVRRPADETVVALLAELVAVEEFEIPAEALETHDGPALTSDDLLDLVLALEQHSAIGFTSQGVSAH